MQSNSVSSNTSQQEQKTEQNEQQNIQFDTSLLSMFVQNQSNQTKRTTLSKSSTDKNSQKNARNKYILNQNTKKQGRGANESNEDFNEGESSKFSMSNTSKNRDSLHSNDTLQDQSNSMQGGGNSSQLSGSHSQKVNNSDFYKQDYMNQIFSGLDEQGSFTNTSNQLNSKNNKSKVTLDLIGPSSEEVKEKVLQKCNLDESSSKIQNKNERQINNVRVMQNIKQIKKQSSNSSGTLNELKNTQPDLDSNDENLSNQEINSKEINIIKEDPKESEQEQEKIKQEIEEEQQDEIDKNSSIAEAEAQAENKNNNSNNNNNDNDISKDNNEQEEKNEQKLNNQEEKSIVKEFEQKTEIQQQNNNTNSPLFQISESLQKQNSNKKEKQQNDNCIKEELEAEDEQDSNVIDQPFRQKLYTQNSEIKSMGIQFSASDPNNLQLKINSSNLTPNGGFQNNINNNFNSNTNSSNNNVGNNNNNIFQFQQMQQQQQNFNMMQQSQRQFFMDLNKNGCNNMISNPSFNPMNFQNNNFNRQMQQQTQQMSQDQYMMFQQQQLQQQQQFCQQIQPENLSTPRQVENNSKSQSSSVNKLSTPINMNNQRQSTEISNQSSNHTSTQKIPHPILVQNQNNQFSNLSTGITDISVHDSEVNFPTNKSSSSLGNSGKIDFSNQKFQGYNQQQQQIGMISSPPFYPNQNQNVHLAQQQNLQLQFQQQGQNMIYPNQQSPNQQLNQLQNHQKYQNKEQWQMNFNHQKIDYNMQNLNQQRSYKQKRQHQKQAHFRQSSSKIMNNNNTNTQNQNMNTQQHFSINQTQSFSYNNYQPNQFQQNAQLQQQQQQLYQQQQQSQQYQQQIGLQLQNNQSYQQFSDNNSSFHSHNHSQQQNFQANINTENPQNFQNSSINQLPTQVSDSASASDALSQCSFQNNNNTSSKGRMNQPMSKDEQQQCEVDLNKIKQGLDNRTTIMIKNIPNKYTDTMLQDAIKEFCDSHMYNFFYLPLDVKNQCNIGYAFINFTQTEYISILYQNFHNMTWPKFKSDKVCQISYARIQGYQALSRHFQFTSVMNSKDKKIKPQFYKNQREKQNQGKHARDNINKLIQKQKQQQSNK